MRNINWFLIHLIFGVWLLVSPYVLGFADMRLAYWHTMAIGLLFAFSSIAGLYYGRGETESNYGLKTS